jgi:hypothetical protein
VLIDYSMKIKGTEGLANVDPSGKIYTICVNNVNVLLHNYTGHFKLSFPR